MNQKRIKIIGIFLVFLLAFPLHFIYTWWPNIFTAIFFPVNESIWEHMKILFDSFLLYGIIEYFLLNYFDIHTRNFLFSIFVGAFTSTILYLILYLPLYYLFGASMLLNIGIMFITIALIEFLQLWIWKQSHINYLDYISIIMMIIIYIFFAYLTFNPPKFFLFFDTKEEKYGIKEYRIQI